MIVFEFIKSNKSKFHTLKLFIPHSCNNARQSAFFFYFYLELQFRPDKVIHFLIHCFTEIGRKLYNKLQLEFFAHLPDAELSKRDLRSIGRKGRHRLQEQDQSLGRTGQLITFDNTKNEYCENNTDG